MIQSRGDVLGQQFHLGGRCVEETVIEVILGIVHYDLLSFRRQMMPREPTPPSPGLSPLVGFWRFEFSRQKVDAYFLFPEGSLKVKVQTAHGLLSMGQNCSRKSIWRTILWDSYLEIPHCYAACWKPNNRHPCLLLAEANSHTISAPILIRRSRGQFCPPRRHVAVYGDVLVVTAAEGSPLPFGGGQRCC